MVPIVVAPLYLPAIAYLKITGLDQLRLDNVARIMEKLCASLIASATVMLLYLLLRRRSEPTTAVLLSLAFAFGTTTWVISSQALWMHGLAQLLITALLLLLTGPCTAWRAIAAGLLCGLIAANRQPDTILAAALGLYALWWAGRKSPSFIAAALVPAGLALAYNLVLTGHVAGAYAYAYSSELKEDNILVGLAGLLFSPAKGLFVFSPFLLVLVFCLPVLYRERRWRGLTVAIGGAAVIQLLGYAMLDWRQGISWGPRWLSDMLPMLFFLLPPVVNSLTRPGRVAFGMACCFAVALEAIGAFTYTGAGDRNLYAASKADKAWAAWDIRNAPFVADMRSTPLPPDLAVKLNGTIDVAAEFDDGGDRAIRPVEVLGWSLANGRSPVDVVVTVDGKPVGATTTFFDRADVVKALGVASPSGWRILFSARDLSPGPHLVAALVRANEGGDPRLLFQRTIIIPDEAERRVSDMVRASHQAAAALSQRQQAPGYWLTSFTDDTRFEKPGSEMNTFLNAVMLDLLDPVAEAAAITPVLDRVRAFLKKQIEPDGLVRYHGLPDAPTIGSLGCAITPDTDDTALVWRVAPDERRELLAQALATIDQFRTADGLYKTWLAPKERYQCIDPGRDANPPDLAIQMHLYMLLERENPAAAKDLCSALHRNVSGEHLSVYYKVAPLIPVWRLNDMRKAGCPLQLPESEKRSPVPGQDIWIDLVEQLQSVDGGNRSDAAYAQTAQLLQKIALNDFSLLKSSPPLLYHNDLNATVRRFYWSEEFGYALWLRLYFQNELVRPGRPCADTTTHNCG